MWESVRAHVARSVGGCVSSWGQGTGIPLACATSSHRTWVGLVFPMTAPKAIMPEAAQKAQSMSSGKSTRMWAGAPS